MGAQISSSAVVFLLTLVCSDLQFSLRLSDVHGKLKCVGDDVFFFKGIIKEKVRRKIGPFFHFFLDYYMAFVFCFLGVLVTF